MGGGGGGCEHLLVFFPSPFCFPHHAPRGRRLRGGGGVGGGGAGAAAVGTLQRADDRHSLVGWGSGPSSLHLPLLQPVTS